MANGNSNYVAGGVMKLLLFLSVCGLTCVVPCMVCGKDNACLLIVSVIFIILISLMFLTSTVWAFADWIRVLVGSFPDGNGIALEEW